VIVLLMAAAAIAIYFGFRAPPIHDELPLGGRNVDISRSSAAQFEASVAADPTDPKRLLAASMDDAVDARVYASTDGGSSWTSQVAPPSLRGPCALSHPAVATGPRRLEVYASLVSDTCQPPDPLLYVAVRRSGSSWRVRRVGASRGYVFDQRPAVAVDAAGTVYVVWPRLLGEFSSRQIVLFSRSADDGATWSKPVRVGGYSGVYGVDLAAAGPGQLYLAVSDGRHRSIDLLRSTDGGSNWSPPLRIARLAEPYVVGCGAGATQVPAQPQRCISAVARIAVSSRRVAVVFADATRNGTYAVYSATTDRALRRFVGPRRVDATARRPADQFLPTVSFDRSTGDLWTCYYDTLGDSTRKHAWYSCTVSGNGARSWARPVHAASAKSNETETGADVDGYGDVEGLVAADDVAHPVWTDNRESLKLAEEIYTAAIPARRVRQR
jgi:hypothetical protein